MMNSFTLAKGKYLMKNSKQQNSKTAAATAIERGDGGGSVDVAGDDDDVCMYLRVRSL
jgi:hypothetical protein